MKIIRNLIIPLAWLAAVFLSLSAIAQPASEGKITYIHNDLLGSPMVATDQSGAVIWREAYTGYGERKNQPADTAQSPRAANKVWYTSRHQDEDTGLVYMGARYYDPALGRFLSVDPVHFVETNVHSFNRYAYANNNPYRFKDPDGRMAVPMVLGTLTALGIGGVIISNCDGCKQSASRAWDAAKEFARGMFNESADSGTKNADIKPSDVTGKTPDEIDRLATGSGLKPKGSDPKNGKGSYVDPVTGEQRVLVHGDHAHVNDSAGNRLDVNGNKVPPNSPEAHLPIKTP